MPDGRRDQRRADVQFHRGIPRHRLALRHAGKANAHRHDRRSGLQRQPCSAATAAQQVRRIAVDLAFRENADRSAGEQMLARLLDRRTCVLVERLQGVEEAGTGGFARHRDDLGAGVQKSRSRNQPEIPVGEKVQAPPAAVEKQQSGNEDRFPARAVICSQDERIARRPYVLEAVNGDDVTARKQCERAQDHTIAQGEMRKRRADDLAGQRRPPGQRIRPHRDRGREVMSLHAP